MGRRHASFGTKEDAAYLRDVVRETRKRPVIDLGALSFFERVFFFFSFFFFFLFLFFILFFFFFLLLFCSFLSLTRVWQVGQVVLLNISLNLRHLLSSTLSHSLPLSHSLSVSLFLTVFLILSSTFPPFSIKLCIHLND